MTNQSLFDEFSDEAGLDNKKPSAGSFTNNENYLLLASSNLLSWLVTVHSFPSEPNLPKIREMLIDELSKFDQYTNDMGYDTRTILASRYCLCTAIDEAILSTPWGSASGWAENSLTSTSYKESSGGERFYIILESMRENPEKNSDILELIYVILSLGFKGKLYDKGRVVIEATQYKLFQTILPYLQELHAPLCFFMRKFTPLRTSKFTFPMWFVLAFFLAIFFMTETFFEYKTYQLEEPVLHKIGELYKNNNAR